MSRPAPRLELPPGWTLSEGQGWRVLADPPADVRDSFARSVVRTLSATPRRLDQRWLYDAHGSALYEAITRTEEYYLTRTEAAILAAAAPELARRTGARTLVELGSGSSAKTRTLLAALLADGPARYVPIDVSAEALGTAARALAAAHPALCVEGVGSTFAHGLHLVRGLSPMLVIFLGSTIGNVPRGELIGFLGGIAETLGPEDAVLVGIDLVKDPAVLEAAYNDAAGITARFTTNLVARMNRELGTAIPLEAVRHEALYDAELQRIEIYSRFDRDLELSVGGKTLAIAAGERILQEVSRKFEVDGFARVARTAGLVVEGVYTDARGWFADVLLRRA